MTLSACGNTFGFQVDDEFKLSWLFDGQVGGLGALEDLVDENDSAFQTKIEN